MNSAAARSAAALSASQLNDRTERVQEVLGSTFVRRLRVVRRLLSRRRPRAGRCAAVTYSDRHSDSREIQAHFFPNEVAVVVSAVDAGRPITAACTLSREQAAEFIAYFTNWLNGPPEP